MDSQATCESVIHSKMALLDKQVSDLKQIADQIPVRLERILAPAGPIDTGPTGDKKAVQSSFAMELGDLGQRVGEITQSLRDVLNRLQL
jgi:hypothetical protein